MINVSEAREMMRILHPVDLLFDALEETEPDFALRQYKKYKLAAGKRQSHYYIL